MLAFSHPLMLPSACTNCVGTLIYVHFAAQYPACLCSCQRFACSLATVHAHDSEPVWLARPSPYGSLIRTSTPVYPGALVLGPTCTITAYQELSLTGQRTTGTYCDKLLG